MMVAMAVVILPVQPTIHSATKNGDHKKTNSQSYAVVVVGHLVRATHDPALGAHEGPLLGQAELLRERFRAAGRRHGVEESFHHLRVSTDATQRGGCHQSYITTTRYIRE